MITIEDKVESFKQIINEDIKNKYEKELSSIVEQTQVAIIRYKAKKYEEIEKLKKEYAVKLESKIEAIHSKTHKEGQDIILNLNKKIYEEFFKSLKENIKLEYQGKLGENYLKKSLESIKNEIKKDDIIYVFDASYDRDKTIIQSVLGDVEVKKSLDIKLGGFEVEDIQKTYRINCSIDLLLDKKYKDILANLKKHLNITI